MPTPHEDPASPTWVPFRGYTCLVCVNKGQKVTASVFLQGSTRHFALEKVPLTGRGAGGVTKLAGLTNHPAPRICLCLPSATMLGFSHGFWALNSSPHACCCGMPPCGHSPAERLLCRCSMVLLSGLQPGGRKTDQWSVPANSLVETLHSLLGLLPGSLALDQRQVSRARRQQSWGHFLCRQRCSWKQEFSPRGCPSSQNPKPRRGNQECTGLPCAVGCGLVAEVL